MNIKEYIEDIGKRIKGEKVLDVGCLGSYDKSQLVRHNHYKKAASEIIGIDYNEDYLRKALDAGNKNLYYCDITNSESIYNISNKFGKFKHIIATDVIEHIDKVGMFCQNMKALMEDDAYLYLTTPNVRSPYWFSMFTKKRPEKINEDHMCWYDEATLGFLLKRYDLIIDKINYCTDNNDKKSARMFNLKFESWMGRRMYLIVRKK